jgi:hypothetical protein
MKMVNKIKKLVSHANWFLRYSIKLHGFKNKHLNETCYILGNGPSLNKTNLNLLKGKYVIGLNKIYLLESREFDITYHVSVNELVIQQSLNEMLDIGAVSFMPYRYVDDSISRSNLVRISLFGRSAFSKNARWALYEGGTVTHVALQLAYYMGFRRVILIGVDHNFVQEGAANSTQVLENDDQNHFTPNYFKGMKWNLADLEYSELSYHKSKLAFEESGREIVDCTVGGKLKVFNKGLLENYV